LPIPAPAAYQATDATAVLAPPRKSSKKLIAVLCALLATILVAALAFIVPNFTAVKAMLGFQPHQSAGRHLRRDQLAVHSAQHQIRTQNPQQH
jgi:hypothetical protein